MAGDEQTDLRGCAEVILPHPAKIKKLEMCNMQSLFERQIDLDFGTVNAQVERWINHVSLPWHAEIIGYIDGSTTWGLLDEKGNKIGNLKITKVNKECNLDYSVVDRRQCVDDADFKFRESVMRFLFDYLEGRCINPLLSSKTENNKVKPSNKKNHRITPHAKRS